MGFSDSSVGQESICNAEDLGSVPGLGTSPGEGKGYPLPYASLENSKDYTVHEILLARILEWVAFSFFKGSSQPRDRTQVFCIADGFFISWATGEAQEYWSG